MVNPRWLNLIGWNAGWFACVLGARAGAPAWGPGVVGAWLLWDWNRQGRRARDGCFLLAVGVVGYLMDSLLVLAGAIRFHPGSLSEGGSIPLWMIALWLNLAGTFNGFLDWLRGRYLLGSVLGIAAGPLAYGGGARLGAIRWGEPFALSIAAIALEWALALPLLLFLHRYITGAPPGACQNQGDREKRQ